MALSWIRNRLFQLVDTMTRTQKRFVLMGVDVLLTPFALYVACVLLTNSLWPVALMQHSAPAFIVLPVLAALMSLALGIPWIKLKAYESLAILKTAALSVLLAVIAFAMTKSLSIPLPLIGVTLFGLIFFLGSVGIRMVMLSSLLWILRSRQQRTRVLIYGAGTTGMQLAAALKNHESIVAVAFIDDNPGLQTMTVAGLKVLSPARIKEIVHERDVDRVLLAMPSVSLPKQARIARRLQALGLDVLAVPSFAQLVGTETLVDNLAPVVPGKFLGRKAVEELETDGVTAYRGKVVLVSGAGGSIGSEICRQLLSYAPRRLVLFEVSELALYEIDRELRARPDVGEVQVVPILGSVADSRIARSVMADQGVEVVIHAAAYKHVPLVEANPVVGMMNNVLGTRTLADAAHEANVERFILISTDKAVRPTNIMGASKRLAELVVQDMARRPGRTTFSMVRFGNVLGSSGSVVPLFKEQIARGGPVTLTHDDVTRFFMTISEAVRLVLLAGSLNAPAGTPQGQRGGDVFVLDMGKPMRIRDLAEQMIQAAGYTVRDEAHPDGDIEIKVIGLRPGEKLHEELLIGEGLLTTPNPKILRAREACLSELDVAKMLQILRTAVASGDAAAVRRLAATYVEGYAPAQPVGLGPELSPQVPPLASAAPAE
jgi:FlaA1/EpsC-like NDP-sugar epimerase